MTVNVVVTQNLGNEFDLGVIEAGKIHVKLGSGLSRDPVTGAISFDAGVLPDDVNVAGLSWNPATNELTLTETDGSSYVVDLGTLAADKFLSSSSFDPVTNVLTLVMTDGSEYQVDLGDLLPVSTSVGVKGDGTAGDPLAFAASSLPDESGGDYDLADAFVMATAANPDGSRVPSEIAAELLHEQMRAAGLLHMSTDVGISGDGSPFGGTPIELAAQELPHQWEDEGNPEVYFVVSAPVRPAGIRVSTLQMAAELWTGYIHNQAENVAETTVTTLLSVDVQDAFGNHLFYALP